VLSANDKRAQGETEMSSAVINEAYWLNREPQPVKPDAELIHDLIMELNTVRLALERAHRKTSCQRRELRRLNRKILAVTNAARLADLVPGEYLSHSEQVYEFDKMHARAKIAEAELERLKGQRA
jgi:hypothetical protein